MLRRLVLSLALLLASFTVTLSAGSASALGQCYAIQFGGNVHVTKAACLTGAPGFHIAAIQFCSQGRYGFYQYGPWVRANDQMSLTPSCAGTVTIRTWMND